MTAMKCFTFSANCASSKSVLPTRACTTAPFSARNSTRPAFIAPTAPAMSVVSVPTLGLGIIPRGPNTRAMGASLGMAEGCATALSKSMAPEPSALMRAMSSASPMTSAPAALASSASAPSANTQTRTLFPVPCGRFAAPRTIMSERLGSIPSRTAMSTVSVNLARAPALTPATASSIVSVGAAASAPPAEPARVAECATRRGGGGASPSGSTNETPRERTPASDVDDEDDDASPAVPAAASEANQPRARASAGCAARSRERGAPMRASARRIAIASDACARVRRGRALDLRCGAIVETSREVSEPSILDELARARELETSAGPTRRGDDYWYRNRCSSRRAPSSRFRRLWWSGFSIDGRFDRTNLNPRFSRFSFEEGSVVSEFNTPFERTSERGWETCFVFRLRRVSCLVVSLAC